jgi:hypothetical protein
MSHNQMKHLSITFSLVIFLIHPVCSQNHETDYESKIKEFTTDTRFFAESVGSIFDHPSIPSPLDHFGTIIGAAGVMHRTSEIYGYYKALADASPNLIMDQSGTTEEGRPFYLITISSQSNITNLVRYKDILSKLADPRKIDKETADQLARDGKPVYYLNGGLHSPEMGSPEMLMELAYRLVTDPSDEIKNILENSIVLINPVSEPDGRDKQVDWYYRYSKERTDWNDGFTRSPPYWGKYVYHDNNRDGLQVSQELTKNIFRVFFDWHPTIMLDLHESVPLLYISTGTGPYNENVDPITIGEWQAISNHEMTALAAQGMPGVFNWAFYDGWWPGYGIWIANNHNSIGRFYETFGNAGANTYLRDISRQRIAGDLITSREWYRPDPPSGKVFWSARNNINYMQAGVLASLTYAADNGATLLKNFYKKGVNNVMTGEKGKVKMFAIPAKQRDPAMAAYLVNQLQNQGIEVHRVKDGEYKNEYAVLLDQPYSKLAVDLLTKQNYPQDAKFPPYDDIAWTLGYLYGVEVQAIDSMKYDRSRLTLLSGLEQYKGNVTGEGVDYILPYKAQSGVLTAIYDAKNRSKKMKAYVVNKKTASGNDTLNTGTIILKGLTSAQAQELAAKHGLDLMAGNAGIDNAHEISLPRIAVYHSWYNTQDEGWVRFTLEQKGIPYTSIDKDDLKTGKLRSLFDVILIPSQRGGATGFINGLNDAFGPMPYIKTEQYPSHGTPDATSDMTGGPGHTGVGNLANFIREGGVLIPLEASAISIADLGIGRQVSSFSPGGLFHPGSIVTVKSRNNTSPILYGFPETFHVFKGNGELLSTAIYNRNLMILQYGTKALEDEMEYTGEIMGMKKPEDEKKEATEKKTEKSTPYVLSGMVRNEKAIIGQGAIFNVPYGSGRVVFFTFNPLHRFLNHHDSSLLWNVLINWNYLDK